MVGFEPFLQKIKSEKTRGYTLIPLLLAYIPLERGVQGPLIGIVF